MLISRQWIESMLSPATGEALSDQAFADAITSLGLEVEGVERFGEGLENVVVAEVKGIEPHPNADKLRLVDVFDGQRTIKVVCGAPNVPDPGGKIAFAKLGAVLPGGFEIGAREIRGVHSEGMICGEDELGIGPDSDGIMILPSDWAPGTPLPQAVPGIVDSVFELSLTPNRPDALGHVGVAADLAVKLRRTCDPHRGVAPGQPIVAQIEAALKGEISLTDVPSEDTLVTLDAPQRCGRYIGRALEGATVAPSPLWMRVRLHRVGLRPINNVVDVTNYVLMLWGQPLHAFDRDKLQEGRVVVRLAKPDEPMTTLDGVDLKLTEADLVIADAMHPQALAGVMGGKDSGVEPGATRLLLEAAWFKPGFVRASARRHGLNTDSSYRFERCVDFGDKLTAAAATAEALIVALTGATCTGGLQAVGEQPCIEPIRLRPSRIEAVLGMSIPVEEAKRVLAGLDVKLDVSADDTWTCIPPTHRPDLSIEEDLIEEVVRHYGLDRLPNIPCVPSEPPGLRVHERQRQLDARARLEDRVLDGMRAQGLHEVLASAFGDPDDLAPFASSTPKENAVFVANPLRVQASTMRTHMLPGLLRALGVNVARHARAVGLCEVGRVYDWPEGTSQYEGPTAQIDAQLPRERRRAALVISAGIREEPLGGGRISEVITTVVGRLGLDASLHPVDRAAPIAWLHPGVQAEVRVGDRIVGEVGEVHPDLVRHFDLPQGLRPYYAELDLDVLEGDPIARHASLPRFPSTSRDLSLEIPIEVAAATVIRALQSAEAAAEHLDDGPRLSVGDTAGRKIEVIDDYRGEGVPEGHRALTLRLHYRAPGRSVTDDEVQGLHAAVIETALGEIRTQVPSARAR